MSRIAEEIKRRIKIAVWAYAYEVKNNPLVSDAVFDEEAKRIDPSIRTGRKILDDFFAKDFVNFSGMWVLKHPEMEGLERIYQIILANRREVMSLKEHVSATSVLADAFAHPAMRISARSAKRPDLDQALKAVVNSIQDTFIEAVSEQVEGILQEVYDNYVMLNGEHKDADSANEWESGCDDVVEKAIAEYEQHLSADWLGKNMVNTDLHKAGQIKKFSDKLALEYYKNVTHGQTPAAIMKASGITAEMVSEALVRHNNPSTQEKNAMAEEQDEELKNVLAKIADHVGKDHDELTVYDDLDLASEDDDILAMGAGARLGLDEADVRVLQCQRLEHGRETPQVLHEGVKSAIKAGAKPTVNKKATKSTKVDAKTAKKGKAAVVEKVEAKVAADTISASSLAALKACGLTDAELATSMKVSRATANNWVAGKSECKPDEAQMSFLRDEAVTRINKLMEVLAEIDGTEAEMVF